MILNSMRSAISSYLQYEEALTRLQAVVQGIPDDEMKYVKKAIKQRAKSYGQSSLQTVDECVEVILKGAEFNDTSLGIWVTMIKEEKR